MKKKETTIEDLARMVNSGFEESRKHADKRFEQVDKRFEQVDKRLNEIDKRLDRMDRRLVAIEDEQIEIKSKLDDVAYKSELKELDKKFEKRFLAMERKFAR
jgi:septation ring formation regulator EzrA